MRCLAETEPLHEHVRSGDARVRQPFHFSKTSLIRRVTHKDSMPYSYKLKNYSVGVLAILTATLLGCGGGGRDPILGANVALVVAAPTPVPILPVETPVIPGATCASPTATMPTVTQTNPTDGNQFVPTSTSGVAGGGTAITATFSLPMNAATITPANFSVTPTGSPALTPASVAYDPVTRVATFTTSSALQADTVYNAVVSKAVSSAAGTSMGCDVAWAFKTAAAPVVAASPFNLGRASTFAIAATAGITNTPTLPLTAIVGDVVLNPTATCNAVAVDNIGGFGLCGGSPPAIVGKVVTPTYPDTTTANNVQADLRATYLSLTPPAGPPAAGSLGGATPIAAPTALGAPTGSAAVPGSNVFFPGVYISNTSILVSNDLTLDAQGNADAVFVFQSASTVGTAPNGRILLINGAKASNVWWQVGSSATLGTNTTWQGNILAAASITMNTGATSCGRLLAGAFTAGAFVFDKNVVNVPGNPASPPTCL